jgi:putative oxidoreductase
MKNIARRKWMKAPTERLLSIGQTSMSTDIALLMLRIMVTSSLIYHYSADKIPDWNMLTHKDPPLGPIGIGAVPSLALAAFTDLFCSSLVLIGLVTRTASLLCALCLFGAVFFISHALTTPYWPFPHEGHGELGWLYLAVCLFIMIVGPGRHSLDSKLAFFKTRANQKQIELSND